MLSVATTAQIRNLEATWIAKCKAGWAQVLMELAGAAAAQIACKMLGGRKGKVLIFCGNGNNGGDGLVVARFLKLRNVPVEVWLLGKKEGTGSNQPSMTSEEANANLVIAKNIGIPVSLLSNACKPSFDDVTLIVDALLGTGVDRPVAGLYKEIIERVNESQRVVLAVDLPSGINSDNGQVMGVAMRADATATFGFLKAGLLCHPAADLCGRLHLIDIGLPALGVRSPEIFLSTVDHVCKLLPARKADSHKGTYGTVLTIAGSLSMSGAQLLSAESSLRVGCGLSVLAAPKSLVPHLYGREVIYKPLPETDTVSIHPSAIAELKDELRRASAVVLGPGISTNPQTVEFVQMLVADHLVANDKPPSIIDADALNALAKKPDCIKGQLNQSVLTPHPKELSRLMGLTTAEIQSDRINAALNAAKRFGSVVLLKGANTVIADSYGTVFVNPTGNSAMAKAGAGDVLSGIIGGLLAQGLRPLDAAVAGAYLHGRAGDLASEIYGLAGVMAGEISISIPDALRTICDGVLSPLEKGLDGIQINGR